MSDLPQISEAEFEVMKIVWKHAPISTNEITDQLLQTTSWSPKTIQTLIKRLVTKGALTYEKQIRVFVYTPLVEENEYIGQESNSFLEKFYNGDITAMLSAYIENDKLSETEIDTLRSLLSKRSKKETINVAGFTFSLSKPLAGFCYPMTKYLYNLHSCHKHSFQDYEIHFLSHQVNII